MKTEDEKLITQLSMKLAIALSSVLDEKSDSYIDFEELEKNGKNALFAHAILNIAPAMFVDKILENFEEKDLLEKNYIANRLIFQFSKVVDKEEGEKEKEEDGEE